MNYPKIFHDNRFDDGAPVASGTAAGDFDPLNLRDFKPYTKWQADTLPATVRVDDGSALPADYCAVWGHDMGSQGATLNVRRSPLGTWAGGDDILVATVTPADDDPFILEFASVASQYWGIEITGATVPTLAIAAIGAALEIPATLHEGFDPLSAEPKGQFSRSVTGNPLGRDIDYEEWSQSPTFELLSWAWLRATWKPAWNAHLKAEPFVFSWDPAGHPDELYLVNASGADRTPHKAGSLADLTVNMAGLVE